MAKQAELVSSSKDLATKSGGSSLMVPDDVAFGMTMIEGSSTDAVQISRVALYQGTQEEEDKYGQHQRGVFLDALESRELGTEITILPVFGWMSYSKWNKGEKLPEYSYKDRKQVPKADLEWDGDQPPVATEAVNMIVLIDGEPWPYTFTFKRTGLDAFRKTIDPMQQRRRLQGKGPGLFKLTTRDDKNPDGKPYKRLVATFAGEPSDEMMQRGIQIFRNIEKIKSMAEDQINAEHAAEPSKADHIPI